MPEQGCGSGSGGGGCGGSRGVARRCVRPGRHERFRWWGRSADPVPGAREHADRGPQARRDPAVGGRRRRRGEEVAVRRGVWLSNPELVRRTRLGAARGASRPRTVAGQQPGVRALSCGWAPGPVTGIAVAGLVLPASCLLARKGPAFLQFVCRVPRTCCATRPGVSARQRPCYQDTGAGGQRTLSRESAAVIANLHLAEGGTPTRVGNGRPVAPAGHPGRRHPHAYGEKAIVIPNHMPGQAEPQATCVGSGLPRAPLGANHRRHPHTRGERRW